MSYSEDSGEIERLNFQDCCDLSKVFWKMEHYGESVKYLEIALMKSENSARMHLLLAGSYNLLPEELPNEMREQIEGFRNNLDKDSQWLSEVYQSKTNLQRQVYHLLAYQDLRDDSKIEGEDELLKIIGLDMVFKGVSLESFLAEIIFR